MKFISFLKNLASGKSNVKNTGIDESNFEPYIPEQLFVNNNPPAAERVPEPSTALENPLPVKRRPLEIFFEFGYLANGAADGYRYHDLDLMQQRLLVIATDFRSAIDKTILEHKEWLHEREIHLIESEGLSPRSDAKLRLEIESTKNSIAALQEQKVLSVDGEGLIAHSLQQYKLGFAAGIEQYRQEKIFTEQGT